MPAQAELPRLLCVDDEPALLEALEQQLRKRFEVHTSTSGLHGLQLLASKGPFAVVLSDMRMPQMNGAAFLARVREEAPDTVRLLLTGQTDLDTAIAGVNDGQVFRFLTKPCPPYQLLVNLEAAVKQYELAQVERLLLEKTLRGAVKALTDVLALSSPVAFGRANRLRQRVAAMCEELKLAERWHIEIAAMLSQLGAVALSDETAAKVYAGHALDPSERAVLDSMGRVGRSLLADIPRLEPVLALLERYDQAEPQLASNDLASRLLLLARDYDALECQGVPAARAVQKLSERRAFYGERALQALSRTHRGHEVERLGLCDLEAGMVFADDVFTDRGALLVSRGFEITEGFLARARLYRRGHVKEPLAVLRKGAAMRGDASTHDTNSSKGRL